MNTKVGDFTREYLYPLLLIGTIGVFGWYVTSNQEGAVTQQRLVQAEKQIEAMKEMVVVLRTMQIELVRVDAWKSGVDKELIFLEEKTADRYTRNEASKDLRILEARIDRLEERIKEGQE